MTNPFKAALHGDYQTYYVDAFDRIRVVKEFNLKQCLAALEVEGLQKSVEAAVRRRMRQLEKAGPQLESQPADILRASLFNTAVLLPVGVEVFIFREPGDPRPRVQVCMPDGEDYNFVCTQFHPAPFAPFVDALEAHLKD